jgi:hypothetical protein
MSRSQTILVFLVVAAATAIIGCGDDDDCCRADAVEYDIVASEPRFVVPSAALPPEVEPFASNANVDIQFHAGRLFMAWRSAPFHFASGDTRMFVVSSTDQGATWEFEHDIHIGSDMREPRLLSFGGRLQLFFFEAGTDRNAFEPKRIWRTERAGPRDWRPLEIFRDAPVVPWDLKVRNGVAWLTSYTGDHYAGGEEDPDESDLRVSFEQSTDGDVFSAVGGRDVVYRGGVSEVAFEFDADGGLWAVTRNEDGDASGFGSHVCHAPAADLSAWECPERSDPERYDSPEMFRHRDEIYLIARRDVGGPFDQADPELPFADRKFANWIAYSTRPKRTALYRIDRGNRRVVHLFDLPGAGDNAFASVQQTGRNTFLVANYTSPLDEPDVSWIDGQNSERGTQLYFVTLTFHERGSVVLATPTATRTPVPTATPTPAPLDARVEVVPVFAAPRVPLDVTWPELAGLAGTIDFGDGATGDPETLRHEYSADAAIYAVSVTVSAAGAAETQEGVVARTALRANAPLRRFQLLTPNDPLVQGVIRNVIPAFYWALSADSLAVAADPTASAAFAFDEVAVAALAWSGAGAFESAPLDLDAELTGPGGGPSGSFVGLRDAVFRGTLSGDRISPVLEMSARIVVADVAGVLRNLGGLDEAAAYDLLAGIFDFDPAAPPETAPFVGQFRVESAS